jgi:hypothetical protein
MKDQRDVDHERVVFLDNVTKEPVLALYRNTEKAEPMPHLWAGFLGEVQTLRNQIGLDVFGSTLSTNEAAAINLKNNAHIFPTLITGKEALRSKDNLQASTNNAQRNEGGVFSKGSATVEDGSDILRSRALSLRKKASALTKQADSYEKATDQMDLAGKPSPKETAVGKHGMTYIGDVLTLSRKEVQRYIVDHEEHLTVTAEKLRSEMAGLAAYVHRAEKRLRDLIQLKVAADLKLCRDIKLYGKFEISKWQMTALPSDLHVCECSEVCIQAQQPSSSFTSYIYQDGVLPQQLREDALPSIKMKEEEEDNDMRDDGSSVLAAIATEGEGSSMRNVINVIEEGIPDQEMLVAAAAAAVVLGGQFDAATGGESTVVSEGEAATGTEGETAIETEGEAATGTGGEAAIGTGGEVATEGGGGSTTHYHGMFTGATTSEEPGAALDPPAAASAGDFISDAVEFEEEIRYYESLVLVGSILSAIMIQG